MFRFYIHFYFYFYFYLQALSFYFAIDPASFEIIRFPSKNWPSICLCLYDTKHLKLVRKSYTFVAKGIFRYIFLCIFRYIYLTVKAAMPTMPTMPTMMLCTLYILCLVFHIELHQWHCKPLSLEPNNFMLNTTSK